MKPSHISRDLLFLTIATAHWGLLATGQTHGTVTAVVLAGGIIWTSLLPTRQLWRRLWHWTAGHPADHTKPSTGPSAGWLCRSCGMQFNAHTSTSRRRVAYRHLSRPWRDRSDDCWTPDEYRMHAHLFADDT